MNARGLLPNLRAIIAGFLVFGALAQGGASVERPASQRSLDPIVYHGKIVRPDGKTANGAAQVRIDILSPEPSQCLLWSEYQNVNLEKGGFGLEIGLSANRYLGPKGGSAADFRHVFLNNPGITLSGSSCVSGTSYTPGTTDDRLLTATFTIDGDVVSVERIPVKSVPFAKQALEIGGYGINNLMKISGPGAANVVFTPDEVANLKTAASAAPATLGGGNEILGMNSSGSAQEYKSISAGSGIVINHSAGDIEISTSPASIATALGYTPLTNAVPDGQVVVGNGSGTATSSWFGFGQLRNSVGAVQFPSNCSASQTLVWSSVNDVLTCTNIAISSGVVSGLGALATKNSVDLGTGEASGTLATARLPAFSGGDVTSSAGSASLTLATTGVGAGTYRSVTVDTKGRVTAGTNPTSISGYGITDAVINGGQAGSVSLGSSNANSVSLMSNNTARLTILSNGSVGIGTTTPGRTLEINNAMKISNNGSDGNDGVIGSGTFAAGLNLVGIQTDATYRKFSLWGEVTQQQNGGTNTWTGSTRFNGTVNLKAATLNGSTTIDFSNGNIQYTNGNCGNYAFINMADGGSYMFAVKGTASTTCAFWAYSDGGSTALSVHLPPDHGATTAGTHTIYTMVVIGSDVYISWTPGY